MGVRCAVTRGDGSTRSRPTIVMVRGVREAVAAGCIDQHFIDAARQAARDIVGTRPPPTGGHIWLDADIGDLVHETIDRVGTDKLVLAASEAANDAQFISGWLRRALRTTLDTRARQTSSGRVIRAMDDALREDPNQFCLETGFWRLEADNRELAWQGGHAALADAAWTVETATVRLSQRAAKTPPMAARRDIRAVCATVLEMSGPLAKADLAEVLAQRFNVAFEMRFGYLDLDDRTQGQPVAASMEEAFDIIDDDLAARWMFEQLTGEERKVIGLDVGGASIRDLAGALGCTKYRAGIIKDRLVKKLRLLADLLPNDGQGPTERLLVLVRQHQELRHSIERDGVEHGD